DQVAIGFRQRVDDVVGRPAEQLFQLLDRADHLREFLIWDRAGRGRHRATSRRTVRDRLSCDNWRVLLEKQMRHRDTESTEENTEMLLLCAVLCALRVSVAHSYFEGDPAQTLIILPRTSPRPWAARATAGS